MSQLAGSQDTECNLCDRTADGRTVNFEYKGKLVELHFCHTETRQDILEAIEAHKEYLDNK